MNFLFKDYINILQYSLPQDRKYKPLDLRPKKTRAIRRALTKHESKIKTKKQICKLRKYPKRIFAVKA